MNRKVKFKNTNQKAKTTIKVRYWILKKTGKKNKQVVRKEILDVK